MRTLGLVALMLAGCYAPRLGDAPFTCERGRCPMGYRCASGLCVANDAADPPPVLTVVGGRAQPQPVWVTGRRFAIVWSQEADSDFGGPGLYSNELSPDGLAGRRKILSSLGDLDFALLHPPASDTLVAAVRVNVPGHATLNVYTLSVADVNGDGGFTEVPIYGLNAVPEGYGFSTPSLAARSSNEVMLATAITSPPDRVADNAYCTRFDVASKTHDDGGCTPPKSVTQGSFAAEALVAANDHGFVLFWRDVNVSMVGVLDSQPVFSRDIFTGRLLHPVLLGTQVAAVVRSDGAEGGRKWGFGLGSDGGTRFENEVAQPGAIVPHLVAADDHFLACRLDEDGELIVTALSPVNLASMGEPRRVARVSKAVIESCRLALAPDGTVAVAWKEQVATRSDVFRVFAVLLPP